MTGTVWPTKPKLSAIYYLLSIPLQKEFADKVHRGAERGDIDGHGQTIGRQDKNESKNESRMAREGVCKKCLMFERC